MERILLYLNTNRRFFYLAAVLALLFGVLAIPSFLREGNVNREQQVLVPPTTDAFELAQYYFNHGEYADGAYDLKAARRFYEQALLEDPKGNDLAWYQLGRIDFLEGNFNAAIHKFEKQLEYFDEIHPQVRYMLGLTYAYRARQNGSEVDWDKAALQFEKFLVVLPASPWGRTDLSWIYFSQGKYEKMIPVVSEGLNYHPHNPWLLNMYGLALLNTGDRDKARLQFIAAKEHSTNLTPSDWGRSYPGNDPDAWAEGLEEFRRLLDFNIALTESQN